MLALVLKVLKHVGMLEKNNIMLSCNLSLYLDSPGETSTNGFCCPEHKGKRKAKIRANFYSLL